MKMHSELEKWENVFNNSIEKMGKEKLDYKLISIMLKETSFTKEKLSDLASNREFSEQLTVLTENRITAFELLSLILGKNDFIQNFDNIYFHGLDLKSFDNHYVFDEEMTSN
jgi:hypothetical protein